MSKGEALLLDMQSRLAVSSGSACTSANPEPSHVLRALGLSEDLVRGSLRFGLGRFNTADDVETAIEVVADSVTRSAKAQQHGQRLALGSRIGRPKLPQLFQRRL